MYNIQNTYIGVEKNMLVSSNRDITVLSTLHKYMIDNKVFNTSIFPKYYRTFADDAYSFDLIQSTAVLL